MDYLKIDLTETVAAMAEAAVVHDFDQKTWDGLTGVEKQHVLQSMLKLLLPAADTFEAAVRASIAEDIRTVAARKDRIRPLEKHAETPTDLANDFEWAAMIAERSVA